MSIILSILRLLLAFAVMASAGGADAGAGKAFPVTIALRQGDRSILDTDVPVAWGVRSGEGVVRPDGFTVDLLATRADIAGAPAAKIMMLIRRGQGAEQMTVWVPHLMIGCSGRAAVTIDRADDMAGPLHLTLTIDPAAIDPACTRR